ncbi:nucleotidyl transferase AbiEii/AbiGii toxin family protein [Nocardia sp. NPDC055321]
MVSVDESSWDRVEFEHASGPEAGWYLARRRVMDHVLDAVATSGWHRHLVLRGSITLRAWFGAKAREPGDLDFVVTPHRWRWTDVPAERMYDELVGLAADLADAEGEVRIRSRVGFGENVYRFPYRGVPGRRVTVFWECPHTGAGTLGLDFAFGEQLPARPIRTEIPRLATAGPAIALPTVDPASSLAWKLLWMAAETNEDSRARGKDLFDAVLLAEHHTLTPALLRDVLFADYRDYRRAMPGYLDRLPGIAGSVDWWSFTQDYPLLESAREEFTARLVSALAPAFQLPQ